MKPRFTSLTRTSDFYQLEFLYRGCRGDAGIPLRYIDGQSTEDIMISVTAAVLDIVYHIDRTIERST